MTYRDNHARWGRLLLGISLVLSTGCGEELAPTLGQEVTRASAFTSTGQALSSIPPIHDPQLCVLPSGRYVISAEVTNTENVFNVTFLNDGVEGSQPSANCRTMRLRWDEGIPWDSRPPQPPPEADFPKSLLEGWWMNDASPKRFSVKAVWQTDDNLGVITQIAGVNAEGYYHESYDVPDAWRFNWIGAGATTSHTKYFNGFIFNNNNASYGERKIRITDQPTSPASPTIYQSLFCQSGTTRLNDSQFNCSP